MNKKKNNDKRSYILTRETLGMTILLFCLVVTLMLFTNKLIFLGFGNAICTFMYGTFGYASFIVVALLAYLGEWLVFEKKIKVKVRPTIFVVATIVMLFMLFHAVTTATKCDMSTYGTYLSDCYKNAANGFSGYTFGGVICGLLVYPIAKGTTFVGAYVIFSILTVVFGMLSVFAIRSVVLGKSAVRANKTANAEIEDEVDEQQEQVTDIHAQKLDNLYSVNENHEIVTKLRQTESPRRQTAVKQEDSAKKSNDKYSPENLGRKILFEPGEFAAESYRRNMIYNEDSYFNHPVQSDNDYLHSFSSGSTPAREATPPADTTYTSDYASQVGNKGANNDMPSYLYGEEPVDNLGSQPLYREKNDEADYNSYTVDENSSIDYEDEQPADDFESDLDEKYSEPLVPKSEPAPYDLQTDSKEDKPVAGFTENSVEPRIVRNEGIIRSEVAEEKKPLREPEAKPEEKPSERGSRLFDLFSSSNPRLSGERRIEPDVSALQAQRRESSRENLFDEESDDNLFGDQTPLASREEDAKTESPVMPPVRDRGVLNDRADSGMVEAPRRPVPPVVESAPKKVEEPKPPVEEKPKHVWKKYVRPTLDLLDDYPENNNVNTAEIEESKQIICDTLADYRIDSRISNVVVGPAITRYDVIIEDRTNIKNALKYREAIAMALMKENVTAYLNYSKGAISIEVPNSNRCVVGLKGMLASSTFLNAKPNGLTFTLGKNVEGQTVCPDITKMPHLLVAGTTGSGKSICLSTLIVSLLYKYGPEDLRFILVDPKQVEFISYDKLPHLMINEIIYDVDKAIKALNWAIKEMENRYQLFKEMTEKGIATKNLTEYNAHLPEGEEKLPKIVIILDEFGDLMLQAKKDIESRIIRLVQKARACGIHLILATQRPSVDCITGLIKSNLPTRIGFKVNSFDDARCIFDIGGAEKLLGKGDLYFRSAENPDLARIQGCFIDTHEVQKVTDFIKQNNETYFDQSVSDFINTVEEEPVDGPSEDGVAGGDSTKVDDTFIKALKFCVTSNQASVSMIQRRFPIGYMKACKIIDWMENMNYITQSEGSKPRKVLLSREEFVQRYGDVDD
ncbi:MAG: hypothetical protein K2O44_03055 [Clostridia bacterium]|nr:hypothetical protein [Clostridia bacterium]